MMRFFNWANAHRMLLSLGLLIMTFSSCGTPRQSISTRPDYGESEAARRARRQEYLRNQYGATFERLAQQFAVEASRIVSPSSGRDAKGTAEIYSSEIEEYEGGAFSCQATLVWQARDLWKGVPYDWCELVGNIYYFPRTRQAKFVYSSRNEQLVRVSSKSALNKLDEGIVLK